MRPRARGPIEIHRGAGKRYTRILFVPTPSGLTTVGAIQRISRRCSSRGPATIRLKCPLRTCVIGLAWVPALWRERPGARRVASRINTPASPPASSRRRSLPLRIWRRAERSAPTSSVICSGAVQSPQQIIDASRSTTLDQPASLRRPSTRYRASGPPCETGGVRIIHPTPSARRPASLVVSITPSTTHSWALCETCSRPAKLTAAGRSRRSLLSPFASRT